MMKRATTACILLAAVLAIQALLFGAQNADTQQDTLASRLANAKYVSIVENERLAGVHMRVLSEEGYRMQIEQATKREEVNKQAREATLELDRQLEELRGKPVQSLSNDERLKRDEEMTRLNKERSDVNFRVATNQRGPVAYYKLNSVRRDHVELERVRDNADELVLIPFQSIARVTLGQPTKE